VKQVDIRHTGSIKNTCSFNNKGKITMKKNRAISNTGITSNTLTSFKMKLSATILAASLVTMSLSAEVVASRF